MTQSQSVAAPPPFDRKDANLILRSSDEQPIHFRVHKLLLSLGSPFFTHLFTLPQPQGVTHDRAEDELPVIQMAEDQNTLHLLLCFCYPMSIQERAPCMASLQDLQSLMKAAAKFEMEGVQKHARKELMDPRFVETQPLRVFAIACRYGWGAEAKKAARYTLRHPVEQPFVMELEAISAALYHRLQEYHGQCGKAAATHVLLQPFIAEADDMWSWVVCQRCPRAEDPTGGARWWQKKGYYPIVRKWWVEWLQDVATEMKVRPWGETATKFDLMQEAVAKASTCPTCSKTVQEELDIFSRMLAASVEREISSVLIVI